jgi:hypothetical protein
METAFNFHMSGAKRALAGGNRDQASTLVRKALSISNRMQDGQRIGLCLRILKWLRKGVQS